MSIVNAMPSVQTGNDYSTDEQIIGTWIDGKKLFQKTVSCGALPDTSQKLVQTGLSNVVIRNMFGTAYKPSNGTVFPINTLPSFDPIPTLSGSAQIRMITRDYGSIIEIVTGDNRTSFTESYVTLQYTKI